jgi:hypothetical protein
MMYLPWRASGARLQLPRDLEIAYAVGRMGLVTIADTYPLWYGSCHTCRFGFGRLTRLGLLRSLPRPNVISPAWFSLTNRGLEWTAEQAGCDERELRTVASIRDLNKAALSSRNRFWTSLALSCRRSPDIRIEYFRPEWELRPLRQEHVHVVPDALLGLARQEVTGVRRCGWMVEVDNTTERTAVWKSKAAQYAALRSAGRLYGTADWRLLALVPSARRAHSVAVAVTAGGAGAFSFVALTKSLEDGKAFDHALWQCLELAKASEAPPTRCLVDRLSKPIDKADQRQRSMVDRDLPSKNGAISR